MVDFKALLSDWHRPSAEAPWVVEGAPVQEAWWENPRQAELHLLPQSDARFVVIHTEPSEQEIPLRIRLDEGASLHLTHLFLAPAQVRVEIEQASQSHCEVIALQVASSEVAYHTMLNGADAEACFDGAFVVMGQEQSEIRLRTEHNSPACRSNSTVKGVAGGSATGHFEGMVYVAKDAQRSDAQQQSRNILLSEQARITTLPQLEIYADDVRCSHGATVGQLDSEAVLYMRQRGLSEAQARRLQIEGFVDEVVQRTPHAPLGEALVALISQKLAQ